jgi:hypothetical protein
MEFQRGTAKAVLKQTCEVIRAGNHFPAVIVFPVFEIRMIFSICVIGVIGVICGLFLVRNSAQVRASAWPSRIRASVLQATCMKVDRRRAACRTDPIPSFDALPRFLLGK